MTADVYLAISRDVLLTSNQRQHHMAKARHTKTIRELAYLWCKGHRPQPMQKALCDIEVTWPDKRERDVLNLEPTFKACFDGIIGDARNPLSYRLLPSDSDKHLLIGEIRASERRLRTPGIACYLKFRFTEVSDAQLPA